jgi:hypothetical protein
MSVIVLLRSIISPAQHHQVAVPASIRSSGLPVKAKIQCTQPCTTDFSENMGDLTEEMANATAQ